jgi:hypothetical protein
MTEKEIIRLAKRVREAQNLYFATRSRQDLQASKALEKSLDLAIEEYEANNPQLSIDLFA